MKEFQKHFNREAIIATKRQWRPHITEKDVTCPFCIHNKDKLKEVILEAGEGDEPLIKIVANLYPIPNSECVKGIHDVVIDTPDHLARPKDFTVAHWHLLLLTMHQRWHDLMRQESIQFIQIFKNDGQAAGASISHSHWQIVALEDIPLKMKRQYLFSGATNNHDCFLCHLKKQQGFLVGEEGQWQIWVPPVQEFDGEVWLVPKQHYTHYGQVPTEALENLGRAMKNILVAYNKMNTGVAYNICFMSGDLEKEYSHCFYYHFHIRIMMRIGHIAGFEISTGCHVVRQSPQYYAEELKRLLEEMKE